MLYQQESYNIIGAAMEVHKVIGTGFTEPVYHEHLSQVYNYLKASGMKLGLLINFGRDSLMYERIPCTKKFAQSAKFADNQ